MKIKALNEKMFSTKDCQDIIDEIKDQYIRGVDYFYKKLQSEFEQFDFISNALYVGGKQTCFHLVQKGTRFGIFSGYKVSVIQSIDFLQIMPIDLGDNKDFVFIAMNDSFKWGVYKGKFWRDNETEILPFIFDDINIPTEDIYPVKYNGKWGLYYSYGKEYVIEPQYEDAGIIREGLWAVKKGGKWGFVDLFNNCQIPFNYIQVSDFSKGYSHVVVDSFAEDDGKVLIDHQGKSVHFKNPQLYEEKYWQGLERKKSYVNNVEYFLFCEWQG